jgi:hypothetical protein
MDMDSPHSRKNVQPLERNIQTKIRSTTVSAQPVARARVAVLHPFSQLLNRSTNDPPI